MTDIPMNESLWKESTENTHLIFMTVFMSIPQTIFKKDTIECISSEAISVSFHFILMCTYYHSNEHFRDVQDSLDVIKLLYLLSEEALMPTNENL